MRRLGAIVCACAALGCGSESGSGSDASASDSAVGFDLGIDLGAEATGDAPTTLPDGRACPAIDLVPANATLYIDTATSPPTPAMQTFVATLESCDGSMKDVTAEIMCTIDDKSIGDFVKNLFTSAPCLPHVPCGALAGVTAHVQCCAESACGDAELTIVQLRETGDHRDFYFLEPYLAPPSPARDVLKFNTDIKQTDLALSIDTSSSNAPALTALKADFVSKIVPGLTAAIPDIGIGVATHEDYPVDGYGTSGCDLPARIAQVVTTDVSTMSGALSATTSHCGGDEPESQLAALLYVATGKELDWLGGSVPSTSPSPGTTGGIGFRAGSLPLFVEISDAHMHDAVVTPYGADVTTPPSASEVEGAIEALHGEFVGVLDVHHTSDESQYDALSDATASAIDPAAFGGACGAGQCCTATSGVGRAPDGPGGTCRLVFEIDDGVGLADAIVHAVQAISIGSAFDVTAIASNDPTNPVDATKFIKALRAMDTGSPTEGCPPHAAKDTDGDGIEDTFVSVTLGTPFCFEIEVQMNTTVPTPLTPLMLDAFVDVVGEPGGVKLDRRSVLFLVPAK